MNSLAPVPAIRVAGPGDIDPVARIVARAFDHLEVIAFLVPDPNRRRRVPQAWYRLYIEHAIRGAGHVLVTDNYTAAAVWFDRTGEATDPDDYTERLAAVAGDDLPRFQELDQKMADLHPHAPHRHLLFLAVDPDCWNHGYGSLLMDVTHAELDANGESAYLEATGKDNARLYERHGYTHMDPPTINLSDGTVLYRMWRPPQTRASESSVA
jgi:GNAT superfamily N-acetyltransferase